MKLATVVENIQAEGILKLKISKHERTTRGNTQLPGVAFAIRYGTLKCKTNNIL